MSQTTADTDMPGDFQPETQSVEAATSTKDFAPTPVDSEYARAKDWLILLQTDLQSFSDAAIKRMGAALTAWQKLDTNLTVWEGDTTQGNVSIPDPSEVNKQVGNWAFMVHDTRESMCKLLCLLSDLLEDASRVAESTNDILRCQTELSRWVAGASLGSKTCAQHGHGKTHGKPLYADKIAALSTRPSEMQEKSEPGNLHGGLQGMFKFDLQNRTFPAVMESNFEAVKHSQSTFLTLKENLDYHFGRVRNVSIGPKGISVGSDEVGDIEPLSAKGYLSAGVQSLLPPTLDMLNSFIAYYSDYQDRVMKVSDHLAKVRADRRSLIEAAKEGTTSACASGGM
ncbi:uncharacterized protein MKK02DRAFT_31451 [Dioszegia hungarica]|uniref:Uncharacterized protein n=1 Tax=Dioszegia hungarica TaxID=4972 RepID=A0AA38LXV6_9TREE|nr:uncharacterized protein MKK02DRAFT_31451 [Dioszegia hungarica]KAI9637906.1 hypothetical protein MKK02DRAFT_31451 [Dioszegia hungarica]